MGCCGSNAPGDPQTAQANKHIADGMKQHRKAEAILKKLLLLGAGSSGKSTLFRQLKCIHGWGLEEIDLDEARHNGRQNVVQGMLTLLVKNARLTDEDPERYADILVDPDAPGIKEDISAIMPWVEENFQNPEKETLDWKVLADVGCSIKRLWDMPQIKKTYALRYNRFAIFENVDHFFDKADQVMREDYTPNHEDVLLTRIRTTGIIEKTYEISQNFFAIVDVGGQRSERKKWIHCFEKVTAVIFVAALNHYNTVLFEDENKNSMHESLDLFREICNSKWFRRTEMILFLNKDDLFQELLRNENSLAVAFTNHPNWTGEEWVPDYSGPRAIERGANEYFVPSHLRPHYEEWQKKQRGKQRVETCKAEAEVKEQHSRAPFDAEEFNDVTMEEQEEFFEHCHSTAVAFIEKQYVAQNLIEDKRVFVHITTATDRKNVERVFWDVQEIVIRSNLRYGGFV